jgi:hypothetical protein
MASEKREGSQVTPKGAKMRLDFSFFVLRLLFVVEDGKGLNYH